MIPQIKTRTLFTSIIISLIIWMMASSLKGQTGLQYREVGKQFEDARAFDKAIEQYDLALPLLKKEIDKAPYYQVRRDLTYCYIDNKKYEKAEVCAKLGIQECISEFPDSFMIELPKLYHALGQVYLDNNQFEEARTANRQAFKLYSLLEDEKERKRYQSYMYNNIGSTFSRARRIDSALIYFEKALPLKMEVLGVSSNSTQNTLRNISRIYQDWGYLDKAIEIQTKALNAALEDGNKFGEALSYDGLSQMYQRKYDYTTSKNYISKSFQIFKELGLNYKENLAYSYHQMGNALEAEKAHKESVEWYRQAKTQLREVFKNASYQEGISTMTLGKAFNYMAEQKEEDPSFDYNGMTVEDLRKQSLDYYEENINLFNESVGPDHIRFIELWLSRGNTYLDAGDSLLAHQDFTKAYERAYEKTPEKSYDRALSCLNLARTTMPIDSAIALCQEGLWELSNGWAFKTDRDNPNPEQVFYTHWSLTFLEYKSDFLLSAFKNEEDPNRLLDGLAAILSADKLIDDSRLQMLNNNAKYDLAKKGYKLYSQGLELCYQMKSDEVLDSAFHFMEKSKALVLLENLHKGKHLKGALIPDSLSQKIRFLEEEIAALSSKQNKLYNSDSLATLGEQIFDLEVKKGEIQEKINADYPIVEKTQKWIDVVTLEDIKKNLLSNESVYEYFDAENYLFILKINKQSEKLYRVDKADYEASLDSLLLLINDPKIALERSNQPAIWNQYIRHGRKLYHQLLPDYKEEEIIIVPDGKINFLPFETLLTSPVSSKNINYSNLPFLIKLATIKYAFSSTLLLAELSPTAVYEKDVLALAPSYSEQAQTDIRALSRGGFADLKFTRQEVNAISKVLSSTALYAEKATIEAFRALANDHRIVHLAMHAFIDEEDPMLSGMIFTDYDKNKSNILHAYQIYSMSLNADLVVLSACNTGIGNYEKGEGIMSLSRAFKHAGVNKIITTLWQANDESTSSIMSGFYRYLSKGDDEPTAIRKAKLDYIENSDHSFPHYWAAPIMISGHLNQTTLLDQTWFRFLIGILILLMVWKVISMIRRKNQSI